MADDDMFSELARRTQLSKLIATSCVRRACARVGVDAEHVTRADLSVVLPELEQAVRTFHTKERAEAVVANLRAI